MLGCFDSFLFLLFHSLFLPLHLYFTTYFLFHFIYFCPTSSLLSFCPFLSFFVPLGFVVRQWRDPSDRPYSASYKSTGSNIKSLGDVSDAAYSASKSYSQINTGSTAGWGSQRKERKLQRENMKNDPCTTPSSSQSNSGDNVPDTVKDNRRNKGTNQAEIRQKSEIEISTEKEVTFTTPVIEKKNSSQEEKEEISCSSSNPLNEQILDHVINDNNEEKEKIENLSNSNTPIINSIKRNIQNITTSISKKPQMIKNKSNSELSSSKNNTITYDDTTVFQNDSKESDNMDQKYFLNSMLKEEESPAKYESLRDAFKMR
jgi:hypothetical protein